MQPVNQRDNSRSHARTDRVWAELLTDSSLGHGGPFFCISWLLRQGPQHGRRLFNGWVRPNGGSWIRLTTSPNGNESVRQQVRVIGAHEIHIA